MSKQVPHGVIKNGLYIKRVRESAHLYRKLDAWALDTAVVETLCGLGVKGVVVQDTESGFSYYTPLSNFIVYATPIEYGEHHEQLALPREYWEVL